MPYIYIYIYIYTAYVYRSCGVISAVYSVHMADLSDRACLKRGSTAARLLGLWVRTLPGAWMCVLSVVR